MDAHFNEYLAAVAGMAEVYGTATDEQPAVEDVAAAEVSVGEIA